MRPPGFASTLGVTLSPLLEVSWQARDTTCSSAQIRGQTSACMGLSWVRSSLESCLPSYLPVSRPSGKPLREWGALHCVHSGCPSRGSSVYNTLPVAKGFSNNVIPCDTAAPWIYTFMQTPLPISAGQRKVVLHIVAGPFQAAKRYIYINLY
jgi:hypothetical protein